MERQAPEQNPTAITLLQILLVLLMVAIRFAEPVGDGDLFWQMAYGKYMLAHRTLVPDHTLYSWTPADNPVIYCSWLAEVVLYGLHQLGGLGLLFALRYAVVLFTVFLAVRYARKVGWSWRSEFWLTVAWMTITTYVGSILKPELFSLGFISLFAYLLYSFRLAVDRNAPYRRYLVGLVVTMALWANTHGVFFFGLLTLVVYLGGEVVNWLLSPRLALAREARTPFVLTVIGCWLAALLTPYHYHYLAQLLNELLGLVGNQQSAGDKAAYQSLAAHLSIWKALAFHFHEYMVLGWLGWLTAATWLACKGEPGGRVDWTYISVNGFLMVIFTIYLRSTFYWPVFFVFSTLYVLDVVRRHNPQPDTVELNTMDLGFAYGLVSTWILYFFFLPKFAGVFNKPPDVAAKWCTLGLMGLFTLLLVFYLVFRHTQGTDKAFLRPRTWMATLALLLTFGISARASHEAIYLPYSASWFGFGITYWNPVDEVEFLKKFHPDVKRLINDYDSGGYLLWKLYPPTLVMIDPRSFPYRKFWAEYIDFERGKLGLEFLDRFPGDKPDVAVISLKNQALYRTFLFSKEWVPGWLGTAYVIFVKRGFQYPEEAKNFMPDRFKTIRNAQKAFQIFQFGIDARLYQISWDMLQVMQERFNTTPEEQLLVKNLEAYKLGFQMIEANDLEGAIAAHERAWKYGRLYNPGVIISLYKHKLARLQKAGLPESDPQIQMLLNKAQLLQAGAPPGDLVP